VPEPDSRFLCTQDGHRTGGGLFSLDGVHPTTIGYGIIAQEFINVMCRAGVEFRHPNGTPRPGPIRVDFDRLIRLDTLLTKPPGYLTKGLSVIEWADERLDLIKRVLSFGS
jgi:hypothetical protein